MASAYSTDLKLELMVTGENSGTWGTKTNTNLNLVQQAIAGYEEKSIAGGVQTTQLPITQETLSLGRNAIIKFTGAITGNQTVQLAAGIEKTYILQNATTGSFTVAVEQTGGTGVTFSATDKGFKQVFADGTNIVDVPLGTPGGSNTQIQFNNSDAFGGSANLIWDGTNVVVDSEGEVRFGDASGAEYAGLKAPSTVSASYTLSLPSATGTVNQAIVTNGSGVLSFSDVQASAATLTAIAALAVTDSNIIVGNGATWVAETGATARTSLGLGTASDVQFDSFGVGTAASGTTGEIRATNDVTAFYSDRRLKNISGNIPNSLEKILSLNGVHYTNNEVAHKHGYSNTNRQVGVIAQEVESILPEIVKPAPFDIGQKEDGSEYSISGENYKTVQYEKLVPLLIEGIKELNKKIEEMKNNG